MSKGKVAAVIVGSVGALMIIGAFGQQDNLTEPDKVMELLINIKLIYGSALVFIGYLWYKLLDVTEKIRNFRISRSRRRKEELERYLDWRDNFECNRLVG